MERNIMGELDMYRQAGTTPNFTEVGRRYGLNRHTVAKYWKSGGRIEDARSERPSAFDAVKGVIAEKAAMPGSSKKAIHEYLLDRHADKKLPGYNALTSYMRRHDIVCGIPDEGADPHPRYETPPGQQMQFDWKEGIRMHDVDGVLYEFNVFSATLGYSRLHRYRYSVTKTTDDLLGCMLSVMVANGGTTEKCMTDNMSALVTVSGGRRKKVERAWRFAAEAGFDLEICAVRTPETKGKDESANRFLNRLKVYDGDFRGEDELVAIIERIEHRCNAEPNDTTGLPPAVLFMKEKEHLRPLGNVRSLESLIGDVSTQVVPSTMLVRAAGREWSVPRRCIGRKVKKVLTASGQLRVMMGSDVVAVHDTTAASQPFNYKAEHYEQALSAKPRYEDEDIAAAARANLELLNGLGTVGA